MINPCANKLRVKGEKVTRNNATRAIMAPWGLCCLAAVTPDEHEISIEDEMFDELDLHGEADLVAISVIATATSSRAYELGDHFRSRGIPVIMGGIMASAEPESVLEHADAVVVGEPETIWEGILEDLKAGKMKGIYKPEKLHDLKNLPHPRLDLLKNKNKYEVFQYIQATRGCPHKCIFCSSTVFWDKFRKRPVDDVIAELKTLDRRKPLMFMDEYVGVHKKYYREILEKMIPLKLTWFCQTGMDVVSDPEMMDLFAKSGCKCVFIGFESPNKDSLIKSDKPHHSSESYKQIIRSLNKRGIVVQGGFVLGLDHDDPGTFKRLQKFIDDSQIDTVQFNIVYPYPGTKMRTQLIQEGRVTSNDYDNYLFDGINYLPMSMTQDELHKGYTWIVKKNSSFKAIFMRSLRKLLRGQFQVAVICYLMNRGTRRSHKHILRNLTMIDPIRRPKEKKKVS